MDKKEIKLRYPIGGNGAVLSTLYLRRPTVRDRLTVERLDGTEAEKEVVFIANLCDVTPDQIKDLDLAADYVRVQEALAGFFT